MNIRTFLSFFLSLFVSFSALGYIPHFDYILNRTAKQHGSGIYLIDLDITLSSANNNPVTLHEQWLVEDAKSLRVRVTQKQDGIEPETVTYLYNDNQRYNLDETGKLIKVSMSTEFIEPLFHFRSTAFIKQWLYKMKVIPRSGLADAPKIGKVEDIKPNLGIDFIRLSRALGLVNYAIGLKPVQEQFNKQPLLWIEQDFFHVRKWRTLKEAVISADKYQQHRNNFWFPQQREVFWNENRATLSVTQIKSLGSSSRLHQRLAVSSLDIKKEPALKTNLSEDELIRDFYNRFR